MVDDGFMRNAVSLSFTLIELVSPSLKPAMKLVGQLNFRGLPDLDANQLET